MRLLVTVLVGAVLILAGCGGSHGSEADDGDVEREGPQSGARKATEQETAPEDASTQKGEAGTGTEKFTGQDRINYEQARTVWRAFPPKQVAQDLGIAVDVGTSEGLVRIAEKYAEGYRPDFRQAVFEGCLDGLPDPE
jgi:hypothetical protein